MDAPPARLVSDIGQSGDMTDEPAVAQSIEVRPPKNIGFETEDVNDIRFETANERKNGKEPWDKEITS